MYCPNCEAEIASVAEECPVCNADFGAGSAWLPVAQLSRQQALPPIFSRIPKIQHAWQSVVAFVVVGPLVGLFVVACGTESRGALWIVLNPLGLAAAFMVGGPAAFLAGLTYGIVAIIVVFSFPGATVRAGSGALLGAVAGAIGAIIFYGIWLSGAPLYSRKVLEFIQLSLPAGVITGLLSGWLLPVGKQGVPAEERDET